MPERQTLQRARRDKREGKSASTQAGEFVREEIHHIREGRHGARNTRQAIAIGLSKARRAGVELKPPAEGRASRATTRKAERDYARGHGSPARRRVTARRRAASEQALEREPRASASGAALASQARSAARRRSPASRAAAARNAVRTQGTAGRRAAARKAAGTRAAHRTGTRPSGAGATAPSAPAGSA
jgi:hypothetical protein